LLDFVDVELAHPARLDIGDAFGDVGFPSGQVRRLHALVGLEQSQCFADDFTRRAIEARFDVLAHPVFQLWW
jgi:hypothetical protein